MSFDAVPELYAYNARLHSCTAVETVRNVDASGSDRFVALFITLSYCVD